MRNIGVNEAVFIVIGKSKFSSSFFDNRGYFGAVNMIDVREQMVCNMMIKTSEKEI